MKKNLLQQLTEANNLDELNLGLDMTDIQYIRSVTAYAVNQGVGLMEAEIIRKDLIGMAGEAKKEGELLNQRLGDVKEFAKTWQQKESVGIEKTDFILLWKR